jgi:hypothetical protein
MCLALGAPSSAQSVVAADTHYDGRDISAARTAYREAIEAGGLTAAELAHAHRRLGVIAAVTRDMETAALEFRRSLALDPDAAPPPDLAPDQQAVFAQMATEASAVTVSLTEERVGGTVVLTAHVAGGDALVAVGEVRWDGDRAERVRLSGSDFGTETTLEVEVVALDPYGNTVAEGRGRVTRPIVGTPEAVASLPGASVPSATAEASSTSEPAEVDNGRGWKIALAVVAVLAIGAVIGGVIWATRTEQPSYQCCDITSAMGP